MVDADGGICSGVERGTVVDRRIKFDRSDVEPFTHFSKERCCSPSNIRLVCWLLL